MQFDVFIDVILWQASFSRTQECLSSAESTSHPPYPLSQTPAHTINITAVQDRLYPVERNCTSCWVTRGVVTFAIRATL
jgi:hypothetical protein